MMQIARRPLGRPAAGPQSQARSIRNAPPTAAANVQSSMGGKIGGGAADGQGVSRRALSRVLDKIYLGSTEMLVTRLLADEEVGVGGGRRLPPVPSEKDPSYRYCGWPVARQSVNRGSPSFSTDASGPLPRKVYVPSE